MMIYLNGERVQEFPAEAASDALLCYSTPEEAADVLARLQLPRLHEGSRKGTWLEAHEAFDYMSITLPAEAEDAPLQRLELYFAAGKLLCIARPDTLRLLEIAEDWPAKYTQPDLALHQIFSAVNEHNAKTLQALGEEVSDLEDDIAEDVSLDYVSVISGLRKRLLVYKKHHESLVTLLEDLEENENNIIADTQLRYFHFQTNRATRLYQNVLNLRDYVTQVRESYQSQMDIALNRTMKLFTVIAAIFLPLTLIVGWYGMNLQMPEYGFRYAYPVVVAFSALLVIGTVVYFKRKKWF